MAQIYKFFNSGVGDPRKYEATDFAEYFGSVLSTGLLHTNEAPGMKVSVEAGTMNTVVSAGKAIMSGHLYENTTPLTLKHGIPEPTLDRIDRIVLRLNLQNSERNILLDVKEGVSASVPVAPTLQRDQFIHEISLAQIRVRKNTSQLQAVDLVDERLDQSLCGLVYSLISIPSDQLQDFINAKRNQLDDEMNIALNVYLASLSAAEQQLQLDITNWNQQWTDWFTNIQAASFVTATDFAMHTATNATLSQKGHVQLSNAINSTSNTLAATPGAVKQAYDRADAAFLQANDGKTRIANAVTAKGVAASPVDTFPTLATKIGQISTGLSGLTPGNILIFLDAGYVNVTTSIVGEYEKKIEYQSTANGIVRVSFTTRKISGTAIVSLRLYVDGVAVGLERVLINLDTEFVEDVNLPQGSRLQVYSKKTTSNNSTFSITNIKVSANKGILSPNLTP